MKLVAVMMVKDEADIIESVVSHLVSQEVDEIIVADNLSTDGTRDLLADLPVIVEDDPEPGYYQSRKITRLAGLAGERGADWVLPCDADEFWYCPSGGSVKAALARSSNHVEMATSFEQFGPMRGPAKRLCKVVFRWRPGVLVAQGNHDVVGAGPERGSGLLAIREYQYRSLAQLIRKVRNGKAAYDATDLHPMEGAHWREMGAMSDAALRAWWFEHLNTLDVEDPPPWTAG